MQIQFLSQEDPLEEGMATHSSIFAWRIPMDRGAWWAIVLGIAELDMTERLSTEQHSMIPQTQETKRPRVRGSLTGSVKSSAKQDY